MSELKYRWGALRGQVADGFSAQPIVLLVDGQPIETSHPQWRGANKTHLKLRMPASVYDGEGHTLVVQAEDGTTASQAIELTAEELWHDRFDSNLTNAGGLKLSGWVQDAAEPEADVPLVYHFGESEVGPVELSQGRPAIYTRFGGNFQCGFSVRVPEQLLDREPQVARISSVETGVALKGGPHRFDLGTSIENLASSARSRLFNARQVCWNNTENS